MVDLIRLYADNQKNINLFISHSTWMIILAILAISLTIFIIRLIWFSSKFNRSQISFNGAEIGLKDAKINIKPNHQTIQVAYKLWVELSTRKLGLPIDFEHDVIEEIYNSWYEFFKVTRELIKEIPAEHALNKDTQTLISVATKVLNLGVRPHLTKWQARFRNWYKIQTASNQGVLSPQQLQEKFICADDEFCYNNLTNDMLEVNSKLIEYKKILEKIVFNKELKD